MTQIDILREEIRELIKEHNNNHKIMVGYEGSDLMKFNLNKIQSILSKIEKKEKIISLKQKCDNMIKHICDLINDNSKYVMTEACDNNLKLYFNWLNEYMDLENN